VKRGDGTVRRATLLAILALAACAQTQAPVQSRREPPQVPVPATPPAAVPPVAPPSAEVEEARQVSELLGYYQKVAQSGPEDQKRELATATQAFNRDRSNASRVRLALLYVMPGTSFQDEARAAQLLEPLATPGGGGGAVRQFASLLHAQVTERLKTQKRADQLKEQVDALRAIEKQLIDRGQQPPPRK
jgi:hypothetical protein